MLDSKPSRVVFVTLKPAKTPEENFVEGDALVTPMNALPATTEFSVALAEVAPITFPGLETEASMPVAPLFTVTPLWLAVLSVSGVLQTCARVVRTSMTLTKMKRERSIDYEWEKPL